tara:strand:+ start:546 stop:704 length:159 start_codon:yes stop_codon:yes gene_type:complete
MLIAILVIVVVFVGVSLIAMFTEMGTKRTTGTMKGGHKSSGRGGSKSKKKRS